MLIITRCCLFDGEKIHKISVCAKDVTIMFPKKEENFVMVIDYYRFICYVTAERFVHFCGNQFEEET